MNSDIITYLDEVIATTLINNFTIILPTRQLDNKCKSLTEYRRRYRDMIDSYVETFCAPPDKTEKNNTNQFIVLNSFLREYNSFMKGSEIDIYSMINILSSPLFSQRRFKKLDYNYKKKFFIRYIVNVMRHVQSWCIDQAADLAKLRFYEAQTSAIKSQLAALQLRWKEKFKLFLVNEREALYKQIAHVVDQKQPIITAPIQNQKSAIKNMMKKFRAVALKCAELEQENKQLKIKIQMMEKFYDNKPVLQQSPVQQQSPVVESPPVQQQSPVVESPPVQQQSPVVESPPVQQQETVQQQDTVVAKTSPVIPVDVQQQTILPEQVNMIEEESLDESF